MKKLSSSLREKSAESALATAKSVARECGITRVTDTTWLDKIGIPVYASIRPDAIKGSLAVHAGKGLTHIEAEIGAYMEAIEFSFVHAERDDLHVIMKTPREIATSISSNLQFKSFGLRLGVKINSDEQIACVPAEIITNGGGKAWIPAELVYLPYYKNPGRSLFGSSTNGLCSGSTDLEATVHGIAEVLERDVHSFDLLNQKSAIVCGHEVDEQIHLLIQKINLAGLRCCLRYSENIFNLPYFSAYILEPDSENSIPIASGYGLHPIREIAAIRAICEAAQGRSSFIHGGRDDIIKRYNIFSRVDRQDEIQAVEIITASILDESTKVNWLDIPNYDNKIGSLQDALGVLLTALKRAKLENVLRIKLSPDDFPLSVLRIIVPGAEFFEHELKRVGPRLLQSVAI